MTDTALCPNLLVGVSGSIQCTHISHYLLNLRQNFAANIRVIMTRAAAQMVNPSTVDLYTDLPVFQGVWDRAGDVKTPHIQLARWADLFLVLPATANTLGKAANGIADDLLSTTIITHKKPVVFAPAMNPSMFASKAVQRNIQQLKGDGHYVIPPFEGVSITTGEWDVGLTAPPPEEVLLHVRHVRMRELRSEYWDEATRELPVTPAVRKLQKLQARREEMQRAAPIDPAN